ncbi:hypothetical protein [Geodermatophilus amargosae]|uniref:hypothetical protein n=1 Tax=Geodermatophilus amargosae TaxID=1296565 RepID=UPI0034DFEEA9
MIKGSQRADDEQRSLVKDLAAELVEQLDPDELAVFDDAAEDYFRDPEAVLNPRRRDEAVGSGVELALVTPVVLAVAGQVVEYLSGVVVEALGDNVRPRLLRFVRRMLGLGGEDAAEPPSLDSAQVEHVRDVALARARDVGLDEERARLLAESVVGGLRRAA